MRHIAVIGAGSIGAAFAVVFARAGRSVAIFDPDPKRRALVRGEIGQRLENLARAGLLEAAPETVAVRIDVSATLEDSVRGAEWVQECAPEDLKIKQTLFEQIDAAASGDAVLASSSSALTMSSIAVRVRGRHRCLIAHPGNPPYLLPVAELVPAPFTAREVVERADTFLREVGMKPIHVAKEVDGFVFNRLQGALLREAYCLVRDGVATVADIDTLVRDGLGLRWSVVGPFETADLNTRGGIASHAAKMGPAYERMGAQRGQHDPWTPELVATVEQQRRAVLPLEQWDERVAWRDAALMALARKRKPQATAGE